MVFENEILEREYNKALNIVQDILGKDFVDNNMYEVIRVGISPRAARRYGCCKYHNNLCEIELSKKMFNLKEHDRITTLIHEILHTFKDTRGHDYKWTYYANIISNNTDYKISRLSNYGENIDYKYEITCKKCGKTYHRLKLSERTKDNFNCGYMRCGCCKCTDFTIEDIKRGVKIC